MKPSAKLWKVVTFSVVTLLLLSGLSLADGPNQVDWGRPVNGLQMRIYVDRITERYLVPTFRVEMRNVGEKDLLLNLGLMTRNGEQQYPTAVSLTLAGAQGESQRLELKRSLPVGDAGVATLSLPLPVGATYSFPVDLNKYWVTSSTKLAYQLKPGTCHLFAEYLGTRTLVADARGPSLVAAPALYGLLGGFDIVNPEPGGPSTNVLQFEVRSR